MYSSGVGYFLLSKLSTMEIGSSSVTVIKNKFLF
nr:MAG TPA_asm: hypothetical protein [Caudoviricetes sp.]